MIPMTFPSRLNSMNGVHRWRARALSSVTGLTRWVDYIPIKAESIISPLKEMHHDSGGYISIDFVDSVAGLTVGVDYVNVFVDNTATDAWQCSNTGYIPYGVGYGATFSIRPNAIPAGGTFTRASNATTVNANGTLSTVSSGVLRSNDYSDDPTRPGIKIEPQATNLVANSAGDTLNWSVTAGSIGTSSVLLPTGQTGLANTLVEDTATTQHWINDTSVTISAGSTYTRSIFVKAAGRTWCVVSMFDGSFTGKFINLATGAIGGNYIAAPAAFSVSVLGNGWLRVSITNTSTGTTNQLRLLSAAADGTFSFAGSGSSALQYFGSQLETGSVATSYIHTTGAAATRAADVWTFPTSAVPGFSNARGSVVAEMRRGSGATGQKAVFCVSDGTFDNRLTAYLEATNTVGARVVKAGTAQIVYQGTQTSPVGTSKKTAISYAQAGSGFYFGGVSAATSALDASGILLSSIEIGCQVAGAQLNGSIYALDYYPTALPANDLQRLTA